VDRAYGETRYSGPPNGTPTDYRFTGQRYDSYIKLVKMGARWYDPELGRWTSPDKIVPEPSNPQSLNRYSYAKNSPVRFVDPTGYFEEDQLKDWYGDDWRSLFDAIWQEILLMAEFGDVILYGNDLAAMFVQTDGGGMTAWSMSTAGEFSGRGEVSFLDSVANRDPVGLYRSSRANLDREGGPSSSQEFAFDTDVRFRDFRRLVAWANNAPGSIMLGYHWYRSASSNQSVAVRRRCIPFGEFGNDDWVGLGVAVTATAVALHEGAKLGSALVIGLGGFIGLVALPVEVWLWATWDTSFALHNDLGKPPIIPVPRPG
jgi:RHS repeat-associated protein